MTDIKLDESKIEDGQVVQEPVENNDPPEKPSSASTDVESDVVWGDNSFAENLFQQPTKQSEAESDEPDLGDFEPTEEEKREYLANTVGEEDSQMTVKELMSVAEFGIEFVDALNSNAVRWYAKEKKSDQFELETSKKKRLATMLAKVLYIYQVKMGPITGLVLAALLYFGLTWKKGHEVRKSNLELEQQKILERRKERAMKQREAMNNRIISHIAVEALTLKEIAERTGKKAETIKKYLKRLVDNGQIIADHSEGIAKYESAH